ncbi:MAG: histidinol dehydrogenase [Clostridia bacterium]|nr:histidinol dehydrogenase [Clostridia bacterium]
MIRIAEGTQAFEMAARKKTAIPEDIEKSVASMMENIRTNGDSAVKAYTEQFDHVVLTTMEVSPEEIEAAYASVGEDFIRTLEMAAANIRAYHAKQVRSGYAIAEQEGIILGQKITPLKRVGIYVPGGTAAYPSTVLMNAIPAKLAGVPEIIMTTPPGRDGNINPNILAAAKIAGVDRIFRIGGAQAVAALTYGTESVPKVDKIVGPGNIFVQAAKKLAFGEIAIEMIAGPSEILILSDGSSSPAYLAADLLSQAEHDVMATAILITDSRELALAVQQELEVQLSVLPREEIARRSIETNGMILLVSSLDEAVELSNLVAPEHLELAVDDPFALLPRIENAGSIFLGRYAPEPLGDYFAGTNHTLPTGGTARFSSPLSVDDFVKKSSYLYYTKEALSAVHRRIEDFAHREGLDAHASSIAIRFKEE